jgi:hypothetical protein
MDDRASTTDVVSRALRSTPPAIRLLHTLDRVSSAAPVHAPPGAIDLRTWLSELSSDEYAACSPEHHGAIHATLPDGYPVFIATETVGGSLMTHHYVVEVGDTHHLRTVSAASVLWLPNGEVAPMRVTWEITLEPSGTQAGRLVCDTLVESSHDLLVALTAQRPPNTPNPMEIHCAAETQMLAADIQRKALGLPRV